MTRVGDALVFNGAFGAVIGMNYPASIAIVRFQNGRQLLMTEPLVRSLRDELEAAIPDEVSASEVK